ncbi:hypothetical protein Hanom_Chr05g00467351 [Helianthus anomalus]
MLVHKVKKTELPIKLTKRTKIPLPSQRKMDGVTEPDENGQDFKPFGSRCGKTNFWMKITKLAKPQGRKWHFMRILIIEKIDLFMNYTFFVPLLILYKI